MKKTHRFFLLLMGILPSFHSVAQQSEKIDIYSKPHDQLISIDAGGKPFATFFFRDSLEKPVLISIHAPDGQIVTRGFPLLPRAGEPTDHPHHVGLWLNYESVNGLDFWNNSYNIPADNKKNYGWIRTDSITEMKGGNPGILSYRANWKNQAGAAMLKENTSFIFTADEDMRIIDRTTRLTALEDVSFPDTKDGLLGFRVAHELELPSAQPKEFKDNNGIVTKISPDPLVSGNYLSSEGKTGDSVWGTRARWCMLYGRMGSDSISILIIDHPANPGYPTYWHARGYGLFAANPLGQKIFSNGKEVLNYHLKKGETGIFRYRIVISSGKRNPTNESIELLAKSFTGK